MYGLEDADVREWLGSTRWSCRPAVSHAMLQGVMEALAGVGVLTQARRCRGDTGEMQGR